MGMCDARTHQKINPDLCGNIVELGEGTAKLGFKTTEIMRVDETGLIHGGFLFGLADYAAMVAVNQPNVVLAEAEVKFIKPIQVGMELRAEATVNNQEGNKYKVFVQVWHDADEVFYGDFLCIVPTHHVLEKKK
jgi:uncharacterized protein (TIGR00369 family)